jgi:hypothetical protein
MSSTRCFGERRNCRSSAMHRLIVCVLVGGLAALNLPLPARASDDKTELSLTSINSHFDTRTPLRLTLTASAPVHPWAPPAKPSSLLTREVSPRFPSFNPTTAPLSLTKYALPGPGRVYAFPKSALPPSSSRSGRKAWLALGIAGIAVAGIGAGTYAAGESGVCSGGYPSNGCKTTRHVGLALMPVGGVMAVVGFLMHYRR